MFYRKNSQNRDAEKKQDLRKSLLFYFEFRAFSGALFVVLQSVFDKLFYVVFRLEPHSNSQRFTLAEENDRRGAHDSEVEGNVLVFGA